MFVSGEVERERVAIQMAIVVDLRKLKRDSYHGNHQLACHLLGIAIQAHQLTVLQSLCVPDLNRGRLMEERATLRIASQPIGNWLVHSIATSGQVEKAIHGMVTIVGAKNADVPAVAG